MGASYCNNEWFKNGTKAKDTFRKIILKLEMNLQSEENGKFSNTQLGKRGKSTNNNITKINCVIFPLFIIDALEIHKETAMLCNRVHLTLI